MVMDEAPIGIHPFFMPFTIVLYFWK